MSDAPSPPRWSLASRLAFRFVVVYFGTYVAVTQMLSSLVMLPVGDMPEFGTLRPLSTAIAWTARHVFRVGAPLVMTGSGSGDKTFDWVEAFCLLLLAAAGTAIWSVIDRKRAAYPRLYAWFRLFLRLALGSTMLTYGASKAIPVQMPAPGLRRLIEPYGNLSPMGVLWASIGASRGYEIAVGCAELLGGTLLFLPRTTLLGALVCLFDAVQIFLLNMTYDVPVKLFSFHLVLMSVVLIAPDARRLVNFFLLGRPAGPGAPAGSPGRRARVGLAAQAAFGAYLLAMNFYNVHDGWKTYGGGAPHPPLYGIWDVAEMSVDGVTRAPLFTDFDRWRRVIVQDASTIAFQRSDDSLAIYRAAVDVNAKSVMLPRVNAKAPVAQFTFQQPAADRLIFDGTMDGRQVHLGLRLFDQQKFLLVSRGFHWIQEYPFNR